MTISHNVPDISPDLEQIPPKVKDSKDHTTITREEPTEQPEPELDIQPSSGADTAEDLTAQSTPKEVTIVNVYIFLL